MPAGSRGTDQRLLAGHPGRPWLPLARGGTGAGPAFEEEGVAAGRRRCRLAVPKEAPPDQLGMSLYYLNPLCTTTKNKKTLLNSLRYENYKLCTRLPRAREGGREGSCLWWRDLRPRLPRRRARPRAGTAALRPAPCRDGAGPRAGLAPGPATAATGARRRSGSCHRAAAGEGAPAARPSEAEPRSVPAAPARELCGGH